MRFLTFGLIALVACSGGSGTEDSGSDAAQDAVLDVAKDTSSDTGKDVANDVSMDASDGGTDADATPDVIGPDVIVDGAIDVSDGGFPDMGPPDVGPPDVGPPDVGPPDGSMVDGGCNNLVNNAPSISLNYSAGQPPSAQGGNVVTGIYYLTALNYYTGMNGSFGTAALTMEVKQATADSVITQQNMTERATHAWKVNGTTWSMGQLCPQMQQSTGDYTAVNKTLTLFFDDGNGRTIEEVFTRQ